LVPRQITAPVRRLVDRLGEVPFCLCDASWMVLEVNRLWAELEGGGHLPVRETHGISSAEQTPTIVTPADPGWDDARRAWNLAVDQHSAAVALTEPAADVVAAVSFARHLVTT